jgi:hypothetical protein
MNGIEFYEFLRMTYTQNGQPLYGNFTFCDWLYKPRNGTFSFRFNIIYNNPKAIPRNIITTAWDANQEIKLVAIFAESKLSGMLGPGCTLPPQK